MKSEVSEQHQAAMTRVGLIIAYVIIFVVIIRRFYDQPYIPRIPFAVALHGSFVFLFATEFFIVRRIKAYLWIYILLQFVIIQIIGFFPPYIDTYGLLYLPLLLQLKAQLPRRITNLVGISGSVFFILTLMITHGAISGFGRALMIIVITIILLGYEDIYLQSETARRESLLLLAQLQAAHQKLKEYAAQAEAMAVLEERNRMTRELHDSVGQTIFSIALNTQSAFLLLEKDPESMPAQLDRLQGLTSSALGKMRLLISQWKPRQG